MLDFLRFLGLVVIPFIVLPFGLGQMLGRVLRVREYSTKIGFILFTIGLGIAPFYSQMINGRSPLDAIKKGIDLAGGTNLIYELEEKKEEQVTPELMQRMVGAVSRRINPAGTKEVVVRAVGRNRIEVIIPGADPAAVDEIKDAMTKLGSLEFNIVANMKDNRDLIERARQSPSKEVRINGEVRAAWREIAPEQDEAGNKSPNREFDGDPEIAVRQIVGKDEGYKELLVRIEPNDEKRITGRLLKRANPTNDQQGRLAVGFHFNQRGGFLFTQLTSENRPRKDGTTRRLAILLDDKVHSAPTIRSTIGADGIIEGKFSQKEIDNLVNVLNAGALPVPLKRDPISEFSISPTLGLDVQSKGKLALLVSTVAVVVFMGGYYLIAGAVADFAMLLNLLFIVSTMAFIGAAFTLPGLAGLVLSAGMAVDANVLIYERIREETQRGASLRMAIHNGFDRALTAIVDSNLTTLITAFILYMIGTEQVKGFAVSLFIGLVMNLYTAVYVSRVILEVMERSRLVKRLNMLSVIGATNIDFVGKQFIATVASLVLIAAGMIALFARGEQNLDIDFTGGTMVSMQFTTPQTSDDVRRKFEQTFDSNITLEELTRTGAASSDAGRLFRLRTTNQDQNFVEQKISETFPTELVRVQMTAGEIQEIAAPERAKDTDKANEKDEKTEKKADAPEPDVQFAGGHAIDLSFSQELPPSTLSRYLVTELTNLKYSKPDSLITVTGLSGTGMSATEGKARLYDKVQLKATKDVKVADLKKVIEDVRVAMQSRPVFDEVTNFESSVANEAIVSAVIAIVASLIAIIIYVWFRFENLVFGLASVIALIHDVLVSLGCVALGAYLSRTPIGPLFVLTDFKINMAMIAAFLTIVGYSLNDTIVIFDRLREIRGKNPNITRDMINLTINQTLSRTILTALTVFLSVLILYGLGGEGIHGFAFCMVIGSIAGTYSTVYIASPLVLWFIKQAEGRTGQPVAKRPVPVS